MNCENCQSAMLDFVYDDLEESREFEARAHMEQCEACRLSFQKLNKAVWLADQLPQLDPSERVSEKIRLAAYRKFADSPKRSTATKTSIQDHIRRLVDFVGHLAMGRQVAMAMVMLLIVAFGLHFLPHLRRTPKATGGTVVNPDGSGEVGPSSELTPAKPFDLTVDLPRGRIRSKESVGANAPAKNSVATTEAEHAKGTRRGLTSANRTIDEERADRRAIEEPFSVGRRARRSRAGGVVTEGERASLSDQVDRQDSPLVAANEPNEIGFAGEVKNELSGASIPSSAATAKSEPERKSKSASRAVARQTDLIDEPLPYPSQDRPAVKQTESEPPTRSSIPNASEMADLSGEAASDKMDDSIESLYRRGVALLRSGDYSSAIRDLYRVKNSDEAGALRPQTLYYLARSYRALGQYSLAVSNYRLLISGFPRHNQTGPAMLEAARCLRHLGKVEEARELLERATLIPSVADRARRELISLE